MTKNGKTYYYHINGHGDVVALTDESGNVVAQYQYDAWGNIISQSGTMANENPYRYAGYRYDSETGLYYLTARYYNSKTGRFITRDTFQGAQMDPLSLNRYDYVKNNPVMFDDQSGHWSGSIGFGFGSYLSFAVTWSYGKVYLRITRGALLLAGVGAGIGKGVSIAAKEFVERVIESKLGNRIGHWLAKRVVGALASKISKKWLGRITWHMHHSLYATIYANGWRLW